jgi:signal transduction histidine kinase
MDVSTHRFLEGFTPAARARLIACMVRETHPDGAFLFHEGDAADGVYLVLEGEVEIVRAAGKNEKILDSILAGDFLGEVAVLDGFGRSTAARARGDLLVARIPRAILLEILAAEPGTLTLSLFQHVIAHLRKANDLVVSEVVHKKKLSLVGEMASSLMHDLRNPVSSIRLSAELIGTASHEGKIPKWCEGIRLQCDRLTGMAAELMEFSRGEAKLAVSRTDIMEFVEQFKTLNENYLDSIGIKICFIDEPAEIEIDSMRMQRVVLNLITNAAEALAATSDPAIDLHIWVSDSTLFVSVKDNGPGIPPEIQGEIFEPFVTQGKSKGIGLGMAIVRNIVTAHGGTITFETAPGQGTTFLIRLPQPKI